MDTRQALDDYESLATLIGQMRIAANRGEWDKLIALGPQYRHLITGMTDVDEMPDEAARLRMVELLKKILLDDEKIRNDTETWMIQLKVIMQSNQQAQRLNRAYGGI